MLRARLLIRKIKDNRLGTTQCHRSTQTLFDTTSMDNHMVHNLLYNRLDLALRCLIPLDQVHLVDWLPAMLPCDLVLLLGMVLE